MNPTKQATPEEVYLSFSSDVNPNTTQGLLSTIGNFVQRGTKHIHLLIRVRVGKFPAASTFTTPFAHCQSPSAPITPAMLIPLET